MAPWLPPIVMYCPPAQQCSAVAPPAPPRPHPRLRPVPPPCRGPPFSPLPPHPPRASPAIGVCGGEGGALTGGALWVPCSWAGGGALPSLALWARPRAPYLGASPGLSLQGRARRWRGAPGIARERPVRRAPAGRNATPLCARRTARTAGVPPGDKVAGRLATASRLVRPPRASGRVRRGRLTRSPLFPLCIALPQLLHSPMVAPRLRLGAGLCAGGAAQAPQQVKPEENPRLPKQLPRK